MPTITSGDVATAGTTAVLSTLRVIAMRDEIFSYDPSRTPFTLLLNELDRSAVDNPEFKWHEDERMPTLDRINNSGGYTAGATSIVVDNGSYFGVNSLWQVQRTSEVLHVTAVATNTLTVVRSFGSTAAAAVNDNEQLVHVGSAAMEGADAETSRATQEVQKTNYTQIFRTDFGVTGTTMASNLYGGGALPYLHKKRGIDHAIEIELACLWGEKAEATGGAGARRSTGGINTLISTNAKNFGSALTLVEMFDWAEDVFEFGQKTKLLLASRSVASNIALLAKDHLEVGPPPQKSFGIKFNRIVTPHGDWQVASHDLFKGDTYAKYMLCIDTDNVGWRYLSSGGVNRDTMLRTNIQAPDADKRKDEYLTEGGLEAKLEKTHGRGTNASTG